MKIGYCIPTLNGKKYIRACLNSIVNNAKDIDIDIILSDGGSNDGTVEEFKTFCDQSKFFSHHQIIVKSGASHGESIYLGMNLLLKRGCELIGWLNCDDKLSNEFKGFIDSISKKKLSGNLVFYGNSILLKQRRKLLLKKPDKINFADMAIRGIPIISQPASLIKLSTLSVNQPPAMISKKLVNLLNIPCAKDDTLLTGLSKAFCILASN